MKPIRPAPCARIYKHGRLKTRKEMEEDGTISELKNMPLEIMGKSFDELLAVSKPITQEKIDYLKKLVDGVEINLDEPLDPRDE